MASIEYDSYKQKLRAMDETFDNLYKALEIEPSKHEIERLLAEADLTSAEDKLEQAERDRVDAERADEMNARFEDVVLNERAEGRFM